jgi:hypothetical protein
MDTSSENSTENDLDNAQQSVTDSRICCRKADVDQGRFRVREFSFNVPPQSAHRKPALLKSSP